MLIQASVLNLALNLRELSSHFATAVWGAGCHNSRVRPGTSLPNLSKCQYNAMCIEKRLYSLHMYSMMRALPIALSHSQPTSHKVYPVQMR